MKTGTRVGLLQKPSGLLQTFRTCIELLASPSARTCNVVMFLGICFYSIFIHFVLSFARCQWGGHSRQSLSHLWRLLQLLVSCLGLFYWISQRTGHLNDHDLLSMVQPGFFYMFLNFSLKKTKKKTQGQLSEGGKKHFCVLTILLLAWVFNFLKSDLAFIGWKNRYNKEWATPAPVPPPCPRKDQGFRCHKTFMESLLKGNHFYCVIGIFKRGWSETWKSAP